MYFFVHTADEERNEEEHRDFFAFLQPNGCIFYVWRRRGTVKQRNVKATLKTSQKVMKGILQRVFVLWGISFLTFLLTYLAPGDPAEIMLSAGGHMPSAELVAQTRIELGLDRPFLVQYGNWLGNLLQGDWGISYSQKIPVLQKLIECMMPTLKLTIASLILMLLISIPAGIVAAIYQGRWIDGIIRGLTFLGVSMPSFWLGLILLRVFGVVLHWVPVAGGSNDMRSFILPALTLACAMAAKYTRQVRAAVLHEYHQDYVLGARIRGLSELRILCRHVLPNAMLPLITLLGLSVGSLLGGTVVVEVIFSLQGMGNLAVRAITAHDYPLIQGYVLFVALLYMLINQIIDFSYTQLNPRLKEHDPDAVYKST